MAQKEFRQVAVLLHPGDSVAVLKQPLQGGEELNAVGRKLSIPGPIPPGHKVALVDIPEGEPVRKYGQVIGFARTHIQAGEHVHTHNLVFQHSPQNYGFDLEVRPMALHPPENIRQFQGYARSSGRVGTRNYVAVISTVNCSASVCRHIREQFPAEALRRDFPGVDGVIALTHDGGCGCDPGEPLRLLQRVLAGMALHPNIAACVLVGLGCEVNQIEALRRAHDLGRAPQGEPQPVFLNIQSTGGSAKTVQAGVEAVTILLKRANELRRTPQPVSRLILAENCGGSDANSGITANPALGAASDELVRHGGTSVLAETPEIYGAEHLLTGRAASPEVGQKLLERIRWWEAHAAQHNSSLDNNPSPGNKAGGLTNIVEKSLGAVAKGGQAPLAAVYCYAEPITTSGFCFMDTPGYDPVSMTGLVAGGCNIGVFTTGRGSVYGCKPTPCIKVATNTPLFHRMQDDIDINAGTILDGTETVEEVGRRIFEKIISVADGERTRSEIAGIGDEEFVPWQLGPTF